jgi:hypothetical protein
MTYKGLAILRCPIREKRVLQWLTRNYLFRYKGDPDDVYLLRSKDRVQGLCGIEMESEEDLVSEGGQGSKPTRDCENQMPGLVKCGIPNSHSNKGGGGQNTMSEPMEQVLDPKFQSEM